MKEKIYILIILIFALIGIKALLHSGFYTSHDGRHQIVRLVHFHQGIIDGQIPVRWVDRAYHDHGYPLFIFTYRLPFWIAELGYLISHNLTDAIKFSFIISYIVSGITMYFFGSRLWKSKLAGFISAILYIWVPYRFVNIFVRAALGEEYIFVFLPLLFLGILYLSQKKRFLGFLLTSTALACLVLSHALTLVLWIIPIGLWLIVNFFNTKSKRIYTLEIFLSFIWALFLSAYYWMPANFEKQYTQFAASIGDYYKDHFLTIKQLIYSKWGYGFSMAGTINDGMSFQVGPAQWLTIGVLVIGLIFLLLKQKKEYKKYFSYIIFFLLLFCLSIYLMLVQSEWFYHWIKKYMAIDFPWRYLGITIFSSSILAGSLTLVIKSKIIKYLIYISLIGLSLYGNRNHIRVNQYTNFSDLEYKQDQETTNEHNDYAPRWFVENSATNNFKLLTLSGVSNNKLVTKKSNIIKFYSEVMSNKAEIDTHTAYFPGWELFIDGKKENVAFKDGKINVSLNRGNHLITLMFRETNIRNFSNWFSLISLISFVLYITKYARKNI